MKRRTPVKRLIHLAEYFPIPVLRAMLRIVPEGAAYRLATLLGLAAFHLLRIRRTETMTHLASAFPDIDERTRYTIARNAYISIGFTFFEMLMLGHIGKDFFQRVDVQDRGVIERHLASGTGLILVTAHFGSWEMTGAAIASAGYPLTAVAKRQANPHVDAYIQEQRRLLGMKIIVHGAGVRQIVSALRSGETIVLVSDQDAGMKGVFVDFFGRPASTPVGAASLALRYGLPIVVTMALRVRPGYYRMILRDIPVKADDTIQSLAQRYTGVMEDIIREYPEQYFWMHRRWKTRPPADAGNGIAGEMHRHSLERS